MCHPEFFAELSKKIRTDQGMTQEELGKLLGVGQNSVWQWERGANFPKDELLGKIAALSTYTVDELRFAKRAITLNKEGIDLVQFGRFLTTKAA